MNDLKNFLTRSAFLVGMILLPSISSNSNAVLRAAPHAAEILLEPITISAKRITRTKEFAGFKLQGSLDTSVDEKLVYALQAYKELGAPDVEISSLKRHKWNPKSKHRLGKAADFEFSPEMIDWLVSEKGIYWRERYGITFLIEARPGAKILKSYLQDKKYSEFVFQNPSATGPHIHINI